MRVSVPPSGCVPSRRCPGRACGDLGVAVLSSRGPWSPRGGGVLRGSRVGTVSRMGRVGKGSSDVWTGPVGVPSEGLSHPLPQTEAFQAGLDGQWAGRTVQLLEDDGGSLHPVGKDFLTKEVQIVL